MDSRLLALAAIAIVALAALGALAATGALDGVLRPAEPTPLPSATPVPTTPSPTPGPYRQCPASCDDDNPCTADSCSARTGFQCSHDPLDDQYPGCTGDTGTCMAHSCVDGVCSIVPVKPCCGNGVCEQGEACDCPDCTCIVGRVCCERACTIPACSADLDCVDADACTFNVCDNPGTCAAACAHPAKACANGDGCCAAGCDYLSDNDCPAYSKGQAASGDNLSLSVDALFLRQCYRTTTAKEENWLALRFTLANVTEQASFNPAAMTLMDPFWRANYSATSPNGTDCFDRDADFLYYAGPVTQEREWLVYFNYGERVILQQGKTIAIELSNGMRLVWLVQPSG